MQYVHTFNTSLEWAARDVRAAGIFDGDEVITRR